ncbi:hypothetical protein DPMN_050627 [Dreissena polymorpha]|uniref:Uncharacterized protein n=1 Tax=Dreissena polymorpha TaxID=45954 RepID=A0A9D4CGH1_DREPO|nr:hypothetical protein DPMN_050627 [Dreissena polymorpha]
MRREWNGASPEAANGIELNSHLATYMPIVNLHLRTGFKTGLPRSKVKVTLGGER